MKLSDLYDCEHFILKFEGKIYEIIDPRGDLYLKAIIDREDMLSKLLLQLKYHSSWKVRSPENF